MEHKRKCVGCGELKNIDNLIKITRQNADGTVFVNPNSKIFGRSAYLCYNKTCIEDAFRKNKLQKSLRCKISEDLKGIIENEY